MVKRVALNGALSVGGRIRMSGLLEADRFLQAGVMCDFMSQLLFLAVPPSLNRDQPALNVSAIFPRGSAQTRSRSMRSSLLSPAEEMH